MSQTRGTRLRLSPMRRLEIDLLRHARRIPSIPVARRINVAAVASARLAVAERPSWTAIFLRAYGLVCARVPELRQTLIPWPRPHLYQHPSSIAAVMVERDHDGERVLLGGKIRTPESTSLAQLQAHLRRFKEVPLHKKSCFRQLLRLARLPSLLRRFFLWRLLCWRGARRAKRFGTFLLSSYGSRGAEQLHPISVHTTLLTFGPIALGGDVIVRIIYDHRVTDGRVVAQALEELQRVLSHEVVQELQCMPLAKAPPQKTTTAPNQLAAAPTD